jgi:hypothetical protein
MTSERTLPIDARAISLDETEHYLIAEADKPFVRRIMGVYLYDRNSHTHLCEITASYWLIHLYDEVVLTEEGEKLDDFEKERLYQEHETCGSDDTYMHVSAVDSMEENFAKSRYYVYGDPGVSFADVPYEDQMESLREYLNANHML